ncbi:MAG: sulfatase-like hydrolase/transferase [Verrucomicrobia bacterium]|nr:sulfatase-like hydrolase/transferase [Verrucomicrobiota bacterium]
MKRTLLSLVAALLTAGSAVAASVSRPNIVLILADDLGLDGVSCYGADVRKTPNIDKLAAGGVRFETCYASPLCGPTRCLLNTGRYAFRTGGITNMSWRPGGPGAKSADERPVARVLKEAGYATGMAGKWRQVGETPKDWGYDEYTTDPTAGGWYWQTTHQQHTGEKTVPEGTYAGDVVHQFAVDFMRRHKDQPFFFYYSMHHVHGPILRTSDSAKDTTDIGKLYNDNIAYMDKQVGAVVAELEKLGVRDNTLVIFTADNGTALDFPTTIGGRAINGKKGTMLEGGSRVAFIANWPRVTPAGRVSTDIISFADLLPTFADVAEAKLPAGFKYDGVSFATQLHGQAGNPRSYAYVQLGGNWYVRERGYKMNQAHELFDMSDAPFVEKPVPASADTSESKAARQRLTTILADLNPAGGKTDNNADGTPKQKKNKKKNKQE